MKSSSVSVMRRVAAQCKRGSGCFRPATGGEAPSSKTQAPGKLQTSSSNPVRLGGLLMAHTRLVAAAEQLAENLLDACRQGGKSDYDELPTFLEKDRQPGKKTQFGGGHRATAQD